MLELFKRTQKRFKIPQEGIYTFLNPYSYLQARKNFTLYNSFDGIFIDGQWLVYFLNFFNVANTNRVSFDYTSIADHVLKHVESNKYPTAIIGTTNTYNKIFCDYLKYRYPNLLITISSDGYFSNEKQESLILEIIERNIKFVLVGMGAPYQELFLVKLKEAGWEGLAYTCGGFMHQTAKASGHYYPEVFDKLNIRFLYRILDEPKLLKRYFYDYPKFVFLFLKDKFK